MIGMWLNGAAARGTGGVPLDPVAVVVPPCEEAVAVGDGDGADWARAMAGKTRNETASAIADKGTAALACVRPVLGGCIDVHTP